MTETPSRGIRIMTDGSGNITGMTISTALQVLIRLYRRNWDSGSSDFQTLTDVQSRALYVLLTEKGAHGIGKASNGARIDLLGTEQLAEIPSV